MMALVMLCTFLLLAFLIIVAGLLTCDGWEDFKGYLACGCTVIWVPCLLVVMVYLMAKGMQVTVLAIQRDSFLIYPVVGAAVFVLIGVFCLGRTLHKRSDKKWEREKLLRGSL